MDWDFIIGISNIFNFPPLVYAGWRLTTGWKHGKRCMQFYGDLGVSVFLLNNV